MGSNLEPVSIWKKHHNILTTGAAYRNRPGQWNLCIKNNHSMKTHMENVSGRSTRQRKHVTQCSTPPPCNSFVVWMDNMNGNVGSATPSPHSQRNWWFTHSQRFKLYLKPEKNVEIISIQWRISFADHRQRLSHLTCLLDEAYESKRSIGCPTPFVRPSELHATSQHN